MASDKQSSRQSSKGRKRRSQKISDEANANALERRRAFMKQRIAVMTSAEDETPPPLTRRIAGAARSLLAVAINSSEEGLRADETAPADETSGAPARQQGGLPTDFRLRMTALYRARQRQRREADEANINADANLTETLATETPGPTLLAAPRARRPAMVRVGVAAAAVAAMDAPAKTWTPIGPAVLRKGQANNRPATSGRVAGLAIARGGLRVYVASANGGIWRSDDGGQTWRSMMEAWDLNPTTLASDSLACGAVAIDADNPDRVYVGTGEGGGDAYFGVGPIYSDDGGENWITEPTAPGAEPLAGSGFYRLAVDPADRERVVGAAEVGLYRREPLGEGKFHWVGKLAGDFSSVVVARTPHLTTFYAARRRGNVVMSTDGDRWVTIGADFPREDVGRIGLAVQPNNPNVVYALVARQSDAHVLGVWRLDRGDDLWREVEGVPADLFGSDPKEYGQGWYDLAIAVDPNNINRLYLGGSSSDITDIFPSSVYSCLVTSRGAGRRLSYQMIASYIGAEIHADIHALEFTPGDSNRFWVGCDGGLFYTRDATGAATFESRNTGLSTLTMNHLTIHPTEEAVLFCGTQDNGTGRYTGEEAWLHSCWGDGGFAVINWQDPYKVLRTYTFGYMQRAEDGGRAYESWDDASLPAKHRDRAEFYAPLVGTPPNPSAPSEADTVAFGGRRLWLSNTFGRRWRSLPKNDTKVSDKKSQDALPQPFKKSANNFLSLVFASATRIYGGTTIGHVYRYDKEGRQWTRTRIHRTPLPRRGAITSICVDPADESGSSIYVTLAGRGDYRHVWHFDGHRWEARSGPAPPSEQGLMDIQHNAIIVDPAHPEHLYVGADIGIWRSVDGGQTWATFSDALPDAAVLDLALHTERRLLWAATHGRGVYEYDLDGPPAPAVMLYLRDTQLDVGRRVSAEGAPDPTQRGRRVRFGQSPDIKIDVPSKKGVYKTLTNQLNFYQFVDTITDESDRVVTTDAQTTTVVNRVYVQVHNRGRRSACEVQVMLLLARRAAGGERLRLPPGYSQKVRAGHQINTPQWRTLGMQTITEVRAGLPMIAAFDLPSNILPAPSELEGNDEHCLLALLHCQTDPFTAEEIDIETLSPAERKAAFKNLRVVPFQG